MSDIKVELLDHMGDDLAVANAARVSMHKESEWKSTYWTCGDGCCTDWTDVLEEADAKLIRYLAKHKHWTPFAHTAIKLRVTAPIFLARQMFKHKVGLVENEVSRRYVDSEPEFYKPIGWRKRGENIKQGSTNDLVDLVPNQFGRVAPPFLLYQDHCLASIELYNNMLNAGVCPEQARMVLPQSMMTEWIWTGSVASFARVYHLRYDHHAQREAQELAGMINHLIQPLFPVSWSALTDGP